MEKNNLPLTFRQWLTEFVPEFKIDKQATEIVTKLGQWAWRSEKFEIPSLGHYVDKGILLCGGVGTGKSEIMRLLGKYVAWLKSPYRFSSEVVWNFSHLYKTEGNYVFKRISRGNWYFDELALTNDDGVPYLEMINDFGNKIFIGEQLILTRYNEFKRSGLQTHFSTNLTPDQLQKIYGPRSFSRLYEMCNFISYTGKDRRLTAKPTFHNNENNYTPADPQIPTEQINIELKEGFNSQYIQFCATGNFEHMRRAELSSAFELFKSFGVECADDTELHLIRLDVETKRMEDIAKAVPISREEKARLKNLKSMYEKKQLDAEENANVWGMVKIIAVQNYFKTLKSAGAEKIFNV